jgi:hypothetical protein
MAIVLGIGLTPQEIRVLQEFRRVKGDTISLEQLNAIRHPANGGEAPARSLAEKGWLTSGAEGFTITEKGKEFLAIDAKPDVAEAAPAPAPAAAAAKTGDS